jgi:hypothetical protein
MKTDDRWRDQLLRNVAGAGLLRHPRRTKLNDRTLGLEGEITIAGRTVTVALVVDPLLQNRLLTVYLRPWDALGFIPHVDPGGQICFLDQEGIVLDQRRQLDIVCETLKQVRRTLEDGVSGANHGDFVDEFEVYWQRLGGIIVLSSLEPADEVAEVVIGVGPDPHAPLRLAGDARSIVHIADAQRRSGPWTAQRAIYLPLEPGTLLIPPQVGQPFWTVDDVRALLASCSAANRARLSRRYLSERMEVSTQLYQCNHQLGHKSESWCCRRRHPGLDWERRYGCANRRQCPNQRRPSRR